jgi:hypothetical protein
MRSQRRSIISAAVLLFMPLVVSPQNPQPATTVTEPQKVQPESTNKKKPSSRHQHDFLIKGTVFTQEGLGFAGAQIQIRKAGQKSYHWKDVANSRGEFAIRVVQGAQYEVSVIGKGSMQQKKTVDATGSERVEELVFHMEREGSKPS